MPACRASVPPGDPRARGRAGNRAEPAVRAPSLRSSPQPASSLTSLRATLTDDLAPPRVSADGERRLGRRHPSSMTLRRYVSEVGRLLRPAPGRLQEPGFSRVPVSVAVASIDEEVKCCWLAARGEAGRERGHAVGRRRDPGPNAGRFRPNAVHLALPDDGRFRQAPSREFPRRPSTGGQRPWHLPFPVGRSSTRAPAT